MKKISKIVVFLVMVFFLVEGNALAYPFVEVEGYVNPSAATWTNNGDGTLDLSGLVYKFVVVNSFNNARMDTLSLEFENSVFTSVGNVQFLQPTNWAVQPIPSTNSIYQFASAGTTIGLGESLNFSVDVTINETALSDPSLWQEGQIWGQSWTAFDNLGGGDGGSTAPVPEPATMLLFGVGLIGMATVARRINLNLS